MDCTSPRHQLFNQSRSTFSLPTTSLRRAGHTHLGHHSLSHAPGAPFSVEPGGLVAATLPPVPWLPRSEYAASCHASSTREIATRTTSARSIPMGIGATTGERCILGRSCVGTCRSAILRRARECADGYLALPLGVLRSFQNSEPHPNQQPVKLVEVVRLWWTISLSVLLTDMCQ